MGNFWPHSSILLVTLLSQAVLYPNSALVSAITSCFPQRRQSEGPLNEFDDNEAGVPVQRRGILEYFGDRRRIAHHSNGLILPLYVTEAPIFRP